MREAKDRLRELLDGVGSWLDGLRRRLEDTSAFTDSITQAARQAMGMHGLFTTLENHQGCTWDTPVMIDLRIRTALPESEDKVRVVELTSSEIVVPLNVCLEAVAPLLSFLLQALRAMATDSSALDSMLERARGIRMPARPDLPEDKKPN